MTGPSDRISGAQRRLYLICPRCRLTINPRVTSLAIDHCPRCLGRAHTAVPMLSSPGDEVDEADQRLGHRERMAEVGSCGVVAASDGRHRRETEVDRARRYGGGGGENGAPSRFWVATNTGREKQPE